MKRVFQAGRAAGVSALFLWVLAAGARADGFTTTVNDGALTITKYSGTNEAVVIPATIQGQPVVAIGREAFSAARLRSVVIPDPIVRIEERAFIYCSSLTNVAIGRGVANIGDGAFRDCTKLESFTVGAGNPTYASVDGVLFNKIRTTLIQCPARKEGSYEVPAGVVEIGAEAFSRCAGLTNIVIPAGVRRIGGWAFERCGVVSVWIPDSVQQIGDGAFSSCSGLDNAGIGKGVTRLGHRMFERCSSLTRVNISGSVTEIGDWAFYACPRLDAVIIPNGVTVIGHRAFFACTELADIAIPDLVTHIGDYAFSGCTRLTNALVAERVGQIGEGAFADCPGLAAITFQGNAPIAGPDVFSRSDNATVYYLPGTSGWDAMFGDRPTALQE